MRLTRHFELSTGRQDTVDSLQMDVNGHGYARGELRIAPSRFRCQRTGGCCADPYEERLAVYKEKVDGLVGISRVGGCPEMGSGSFGNFAFRWLAEQPEGRD